MNKGTRGRLVLSTLRYLTTGALDGEFSGQKFQSVKILHYLTKTMLVGKLKSRKGA